MMAAPNAKNPMNLRYKLHGLNQLETDKKMFLTPEEIINKYRQRGFEVIDDRFDADKKQPGKKSLNAQQMTENVNKYRLDMAIKNSLKKKEEDKVDAVTDKVDDIEPGN